MNQEHRFLAFDLGAESGRAVVGTLSEGKINLEVLHRFPTEGIVILGTRQWDVARIFGEMVTALRKCAETYGPHLDGIAVDTWGVDFGLLARNGNLIGNPVHYRDKRNEGMFQAAFERMSRREIYDATGIQFMEINTLYQLLAMKQANDPFLEIADSLLMMNDLFTYLLSGVKACEYTNASTSQLLDPFRKDWSDEMFDKMGLPRDIFLKPTPPGTVLGTLLPEIGDATGLSQDVPVIATAGHDTAAAVAAVPALAAEGGEWAFLSSGTWSLMGVELDEPVVNEKAYNADITNEGGVGDTITFLKNISGLWLVQESRRAWAREGEELSYSQLTHEAAEAEPFVSLINESHSSLLAPDDMPAAIRALCREAGYPEPQSRGAVIRCALESLALSYRRTIRNLDDIRGSQTQRLHIIGGGTQNRLLTQMAADACGIPVVAGPIEATGLGNIGVQAMGAGAISSLDEFRKIVSESVDVERFEPSDTAAWGEAEAGLQKRLAK